MKLVRFGVGGEERPGLLDGNGDVRDLSVVVDDITPATLSDTRLGELARLTPEDLALVSPRPRFGPPVAGIGKLVGIGLNYRDHAAESGLPVPAEPIVFMKALSSLGGPDDDVLIPRGAEKVDWEVELGVVIGKRASYVGEANALDHVAGYTVVNDVSERAYQMERGGQGTKGEVPDLPETKALADGQWQASPGRQHGQHDFRRRQARQLPQRVHDAPARRRHLFRNPGWRRHGHEAAGLYPGRRRHAAWRRWPRRATAARRRLGNRPGRRARSPHRRLTAELFAAIFLVTYLSLSVPPIAAGLSVSLTGFLGTTQAYLGAVLVVSATATVLQWLPSRSRGALA
ncbi:fumarylacetoacetate hydrolase family protein [Lichenicoccus sp.]|uniref:fumarylacetoacetate hydrolase family protein n=1 Tax=Lichenicoccus sp. TaxID=2781899 RepID=UPI003D12C8F2